MTLSSGLPVIHMAMWPWLYCFMKTIGAGRFKDVCLKTLDEVAAGSVLKEVGDPFGTGERWDADADSA